MSGEELPRTRKKIQNQTLLQNIKKKHDMQNEKEFDDIKGEEDNINVMSLVDNVKEWTWSDSRSNNHLGP